MTGLSLRVGFVVPRYGRDGWAARRSSADSPSARPPRRRGRRADDLRARPSHVEERAAGRHERVRACSSVDSRSGRATRDGTAGSAADPARLAAPPEGRNPLGRGVGGERGAVRSPGPARRGRPGLLGPYLFGRRSWACPSSPGGRCSSRACTTSRSPSPRRRPRRVSSLSGLHLQLGPGSGAGRQVSPASATARRASSVSGSIPPRPGTRAPFRRRHGLEGPLLVYLGRKETGKNVPLLIQHAARRRVRARITLVLAGDGPVIRRRQARKGSGTWDTSTPPARRRLPRPRRSCVSPPSTSHSRSSSWSPGSRGRPSSSSAVRSRPITYSRRAAAWPSRTSTSSPRPWISC